ncbi:MAG TPA: GlsB/YeaQ/YmgE family stress response membrane protein [Roseiarcus sp.]|nr:GlsB/YeaQ/YmgE family stress response membrane protein [Roseiarcus sp.]
MNEPVTLLGTPNIHFFSLIIIGGLAGWIAGMILGWRHGIFTNILVGIAGSWIGSELASMANVAVFGSLSQFVAALVGSIIVLALWRALSARNATPGGR